MCRCCRPSRLHRHHPWGLPQKACSCCRDLLVAAITIATAPLGPLLRLLPHLISADSGVLLMGGLSVEGLQSSWDRKKLKKRKSCLSVSRYLSGPRGIFLTARKLCPDLCLSQGAFKYGRQSPGVFLPFSFLRSAPLEDTTRPPPPPPCDTLHWPSTARARAHIKVDLGYNPDRLLDWPPLGYYLKPLLVVGPIW